MVGVAPRIDEIDPVNRNRAAGTRALVLINRKSRSGKSDVDAALERLRRTGFDLVEQPVENLSETAQAILEHRERVQAIIIGGGDGTLRNAADSLFAAQLPLGIIPLGTANDLARTLNIPFDPVAAADVIAAGVERRIDLGWVNGTHFFNATMIGLGVGVTRRLSGSRKSRWGVLAYLFAAAEVVMRTRTFRADIRTETETIRVRTAQITIANGRHFGGGLTVDADARIDDELLHLVSLEVEHWWQTVALLPSMWRGTQREKARVRTLQGREFEVRPVKKHRKKVTADGDEIGRTPLHVRVVPRALSVFAPAQQTGEQ